jgi:nitroreductase
MTGPTRDVLEHLALLATRAPSIHNTQPWRLEVVDGAVQVHADRSRQLHVLDPDARQLTLSCGAVVHHLEVAARALGLRAATALLPDADDPDHLADVALSTGDAPSEDEVAHAVDILHRHTVRGRFTNEELPYGLVARLRDIVEGQGAMLRVLQPQEVVGVAVLMDHAESLLLDTPGYAEELGTWVWPAGTVDLRDDGLPDSVVEPGQDRAEEVRGRQFRPERPTSPTSRASLVAALAEHPTLVLLTTVADTPYDWLLAGRALSALLLQAAHEGVAAQPLGQVSDVPSTRVELRGELGVIGVPQMLLRLGHAEGPLETPRRPVDEVLTDHPQ